MASVPHIIRAALEELAGSLRATYAGRLVALRLFGSYARGEATEESDVDVLVVIQGLSRAELYQVVARGAEVATAHNVALRPLVMSEAEYEELRRGDRLLYRELERDGVGL